MAQAGGQHGRGPAAPSYCGSTESQPPRLEQGGEEGGRVRVQQAGLGSLRAVFLNIVSKDLGGGSGRC